MAEPLCKYFGKCGGCTAQHIDYELQLANKKAVLQKAAKFEGVKTFSGSPYGYRNRMDLVFNPCGIGFREKGDWRSVIDIERCEISNSRLNELILGVRHFFPKPDSFDIRKQTGTFRYAVIRTPQNDSSISFVLNEVSPKLGEAIEKVKEFSASTSANNVLVTHMQPNRDLSTGSEFFVVKGNNMLRETLLGKEFLYSVQGFFQNNSEMAEKMHDYCHSLLKQHNTTDAHLLDIYAGVGTFGIINASLFNSVTIIESLKECIDAAEENIKRNNVLNAKAIGLDAMHLNRIELPKPLYVITDPPRVGMHKKTIQQLNYLKPEMILYISCNLEQLGKDLPKLKDYSVKSAALFDLFPQTPHSEAVVELVRQ